jgi:peptidoglycan-associated lipoprotein
MNNVSKKLCLVLASAVLVLAGCRKKPARPAPNQTVLGPAGGGTGLSPTELSAVSDPMSELRPRSEGDVIDDGTTIRNLLQSVYFEFDSSAIKASERSKLQAAKEYLDQNPGTRLLLEGRADWRGTAEYNLGLGDRRANASKRYLATVGVGNDKLETTSKGSLEALQNASEADAAKDRRVDLVIIKAK